MWPATVIHRTGSALIETRLDLRGKKRETGRAVGPKHPQDRGGGGERDGQRHKTLAGHETSECALLRLTARVYVSN